MFNKTDRNKDGLIDFEEFKTHVDENQKKYQQNDDDVCLHHYHPLFEYIFALFRFSLLTVRFILNGFDFHK